MENKVIITVSEKRSLEMWPKNNPSAARINENSPTCAKANELKNDGFFVYLNSEQISIITKGFKMITVKVKIIRGSHISVITPTDKVIPNETKNSNEKKSLKLFILPIIS